MDGEQRVLEAMKKGEKPVRPGDTVKMTVFPEKSPKIRSPKIKDLKEKGRLHLQKVLLCTN